MSCGCNNDNGGVDSSYGNVCRADIPYPSISHESVPSLIDNLVTALYGTFTPTPTIPVPYNTRSVVNGKVVWNIACDPNNTANVYGIPRNAGEGLLCYILRVLNQTGVVDTVTLNGIQTLTNKTLVSPVINGTVNFGTSTIVGGNFSGVTAASANNITGGGSGQLLYQSAAGVTAKLPAGTVGYVLQSNGTSAPQWVTPTATSTAGNIGGGAAGSIPYQTAVDTTTMLAAGTNGQILQTDGTAPSWTSSFSGNALTATTATNLSGGTINGTDGTLSGGLSVAGNVTANQFTGQVVGNVTGNLVGNVTGNVTGTSITLSGGLSNATPLANRNRLINGSFIVNQRGYVSGTATTAANQYTLDRWNVIVSGQSVSWTQNGIDKIITAPVGGIAQVVEGVNMEGGTYVLSWLGTATATINGAAVLNGGTITLPSNTNATIIFTNGTVSNPQLELGTVVTPFERLPYQQIDLLCKRYYWYVNTLSSSTQGGGTAPNFVVTLPVTMRATPTIILNSSLTNANYVTGTPSINKWTFADYGVGYSTKTGTITWYTGQILQSNQIIFYTNGAASFSPAYSTLETNFTGNLATFSAEL